MSNCGTVIKSNKGVILCLVLLFIGNLNSAELKVQWDPNSEPDLEGYRVYFGMQSRNYSNFVDVGNTTTHIVPNLTDGVEYFFAVTAYDTANNESAYSDEVSAVAGGLDNKSPEPPQITSHEIRGLKIEIYWSQNTEGDLKGYKVYYGKSSRNYSNTIEVGNITKYTTPELEPGTEYFFAVTAYDTNNNESGYSNEIKVLIPVSDTTPPSTPIIADHYLFQVKFHISWRANTESDLSGYRVYYGKASRNYDGAWEIGLTTNFTTPDLIQGTTYYFAITAVDTAFNESNYSTEIVVTIPIEDTTPPTVPSISRLEIEGRKVRLFWSRVNSSDLAGYHVYYGTSSRNYDTFFDAGNGENFITPDLSEGVKYYFAITAYDTAGNESDFSKEMVADILILDITPPTIYAVEIRDSIHVYLVYSEPVEQISAETISNYSIDHGIQIFSISLDQNKRIVLLTTSLHQAGISYKLTVNNIKDLAISPNIIEPNSSCTYQYNPNDQIAPIMANIEILDATHVDVTFSESIDRLSAESTQNYHINNGIIVLDARLDENLRVVHLTTSAHQNNIMYTLTVNNIKDRSPNSNVIASNSTMQYTYYEVDDTPPAIYTAEIRADNKVDVTFTEPIEESSAKNAANYTINHGISVLRAELDNNLQIVHLTTSAHQNGITYVITVNNVNDRAYPPNIILPDSKYSYTYNPTDDISPAILLVDIKDATHVNVTFSEDVDRESAENEFNYQINNGIRIIEAKLDMNQRVVHLTTTPHQSGETYILTINNVKDRSPRQNMIEPNSSTAYTYLIEDTSPPEISSVLAVNSTSVEIIFNEIIDRISAETVMNYSISNGVQVISAKLYEDLKTVLLKTTEHQSNYAYLLTVNHIRDRAYPPNIIQANSSFEYRYSSATNSSNLIVSNINVKNYQPAYLNEGDYYYVDRSYTIESIPNNYQNLLWIKTANDDRNQTAQNFMRFNLQKDARVYIAYDSRAKSTPIWLTDNFRPLNDYIQVSDYAGQLRLWERDFTKGSVQLGGNLATGADDVGSMFVVLIRLRKEDQPPQPGDTSDPESLGPANVFLLYQNYPNPFNAGTDIRFQLPENCYVTLTIYNILGQTVRKLIQGDKQAAHHIIHWNGTNSDGLPVPSGVYFSRLEVIRETSKNGKDIRKVIYSDVKKMLFMK